MTDKHESPYAITVNNYLKREEEMRARNAEQQAAKAAARSHIEQLDMPELPTPDRERGYHMINKVEKPRGRPRGEGMKKS